MSVEAPLQFHMFSGELVDNRTSTQRRADREHNVPKQKEMFSIQETVQIGVNLRPWLSEAPKPSLVLVSEDPRSEEQIECDLMREAEALTVSLFTDVVQQDGEDKPEDVDPDNENSHEPPEKAVDGEAVTKFSAYRALVTLVREQAVTLWVDSAYRQRYYNQLPLTIQDAQGAGLTATEISAAMQIGEFLGNRERQAARPTSGLIFDASSANASPPGEAAKTAPASPSPPLNPQPVTRGVEPREGLRARLRREGVSVRTRQPKPTAPEVVPTRWMEREHIQKRLPYLAEGIARLDEDELASLAESMSEVLQETYWTILGITLAHYLDHEQAERP